MDKHAAARLLDTIATYLELKGENPFKARAFGNAARAIETFAGDVDEALASGALAEVEGIGKATLEVVREFARTGRSATLEGLRREVPPGLVEMRRISGLGAAKVRTLYERLHISTVAELELAARNGRLEGTPGFGGKMAEKILRGIAFLNRTSGFRLSHHAARSAAQLRAVVAATPGVLRVETAGSIRRRSEVVRDVDLAVAADVPAAEIAARLGAAAPRLDVTERDGALEVRLEDGTTADVYCATPHQFGHALAWATGSAAHLERLAAHAAQRGLTLDRQGLSRGGSAVPCDDEQAFYAALGLPYIAPELREGGDEVARAAAGMLPRLVAREDLQGSLHCHSVYSDGANAIAELAEAARAAGYRYLGLTDHSVAAAYAGGMKVEAIQRQHAEIDALNRGYDGFRILKGVEADILADGALDYTSQILDSFEFVVGSVHSRMEQDEAAMTQRVLRAMDDPHLTILGHPTGRLLLGRDPYALDVDAVIARAAERGVAIEINGDPQRLDLDWRRCARAREAGAMISIGSDAHSLAGLENTELGLAVARKAGLEARDVVNTRDVDGFLEFAGRRRG